MSLYKKTLITGGAGCIGIPLCNDLIKRGVKVVLFDLEEQIQNIRKYLNKDVQIFAGSILDKSSIRDALNGCDSVIHLAAYLGVKRTESNKLRCLEINVDGTKNILDMSKMSNIKKIIFASSSEVYGEPIDNPITENTTTQGKTVYAVSKLMGEELVKAYSDEFNDIKYSILRYFNTYGPHQVAQFVVTKFIKKVMEGNPPEINGDGKQLRSYNFSHDTARATADVLLSTSTDNITLNIGNGKELIDLMSLANLIISILGKEKEIKPVLMEDFKSSDRSEKREIYTRYCDTKLANSLINYEPRFSLEEGIREVIKVGNFPNSWIDNFK